MNINNIKTNNIKKIDVRDVGLRFLLFRKAIKKTRSKLSEELKIRQSEIIKIENGSIFPRINILHFLSRQYGLNINWIIGIDKSIFLKDFPQSVDIDGNYYRQNSVSEQSEISKEKAGEFMNLMQIPEIEKVIMSKISEIKELLFNSD